jgi:hypothetical protein
VLYDTIFLKPVLHLLWYVYVWCVAATTCSLYSRRDSPALKMGAIRSSETLVLIITSRHQIPEDDLLHRHRRENLKSYLVWYTLLETGGSQVIGFFN